MNVEELESYARLVEIGTPDFIEIKVKRIKKFGAVIASDPPLKRYVLGMLDVFILNIVRLGSTERPKRNARNLTAAMKPTGRGTPYAKTLIKIECLYIFCH